MYDVSPGRELLGTVEQRNRRQRPREADRDYEGNSSPSSRAEGGGGGEESEAMPGNQTGENGGGRAVAPMQNYQA